MPKKPGTRKNKTKLKSVLKQYAINEQKDWGRLVNRPKSRRGSTAKGNVEKRGK